MLVTILTKHGGPFLGPIASLLGLIMNAIYNFFNLFGIQNIALCIFVFTFLVRAILLPFTIKQQKFAKLSSRMNPELQKIQAKYKGKKDEVSLRKQQEETQAIYQKYGANPTSGCLPVVIQLPILFALYYVIYNIPAYVEKVKVMYEKVSIPLSQISGYEDKLKTISKGLRLSGSNNFKTNNYIIDALAQFDNKRWDQLKDSFPQLKDTVTHSLTYIHHANNFFGLNIAERPALVSFTILIPIIAAGLQFVQSKQMQYTNKDSNKDNPAAAAMNSMNVVMPLMSLFFCFTFPIGIGLYWIAGSVFAIIQQYFVNRYMERIDVDELIEKSIAKASKRKPHQIETNGMSLGELARRQTKSIENTVSDKETEKMEKQESSDESEDIKAKQTSTGHKSISEIANLLKNKN